MAYIGPRWSEARPSKAAVTLGRAVDSSRYIATATRRDSHARAMRRSLGVSLGVNVPARRDTSFTPCAAWVRLGLGLGLGSGLGLGMGLGRGLGLGVGLGLGLLRLAACGLR